MFIYEIIDKSFCNQKGECHAKVLLKIIKRYYKISLYAFGGGWGGNSYYRLKDPINKGKYFKEPLDSNTTIEILWPNHTTSIHKITIETTSSTSYEKESNMNLTEVTHHPFINVDHNGTLGKFVLY